MQSNIFQWIFLNPCIPVEDILKLCMQGFDGARINVHRNTILIILGNFLHSRVWSLCNQPSYNFQWVILKPCIYVVDILKLCKWVFDGARNNIDRMEQKIILTDLQPFKLSHFRHLFAL